MGGADLADMLIFLYRTTIKTKRWQLKILFHCVNSAKVNAWLMYRPHWVQRNVPKKTQLFWLKFTVSIASILANAQTVQITIPVRRTSRSSIKGETKKRRHSHCNSVLHIRNDKVVLGKILGAKNKWWHWKTATG